MNRLNLDELAKLWGGRMYGPGGVMEWFHACLDAGVFVHIEGDRYEVHSDRWPAARDILRAHQPEPYWRPEIKAYWNAYYDSQAE